jgi:hypothetical protein
MRILLSRQITQSGYLMGQGIGSEIKACEAILAAIVERKASGIVAQLGAGK